MIGHFVFHFPGIVWRALLEETRSGPGLDSTRATSQFALHKSVQFIDFLLLKEVHEMEDVKLDIRLDYGAGLIFTFLCPGGRATPVAVKSKSFNPEDFHVFSCLFEEIPPT